jgi:nicotinamidase-related amidase
MALALVAAACSATGSGVDAASKSGMLQLNLRTRVEPFKGSEEWRVIEYKHELPADETAIVICDMWDKHWCESASRRCSEIAKRMNPVLEAARSKGVFIVHAPSETMSFYADAPQRKRMQSSPKVNPPIPRDIIDGLFPIDHSDGGCDDQPQCKNYKAWLRQHPALKIAAEDGISDNGEEVYNELSRRGIKNLIVMGVHTNMCVLRRSFAIRQMTQWGLRCMLDRDLTDTMYNPRMSPQVPHEKGTELVVEYIEKYWCPSILSADLLKR